MISTIKNVARLSIVLPLVVTREVISFVNCSLDSHVPNIEGGNCWPYCVFCHSTLDPVTLRTYYSELKKVDHVSEYCHTGEHLKWECPGDHGK